MDLATGTVERRLCPLGVGRRLIPKRLETGDALFRCHIGFIDHAGFDGVKELFD